MQPISRYLFPGLMAVFAVVCLYEVRGDLALISLAPLVRSWDLVALAALCSLLNYAVGAGIYAVAVLVGAISFLPGGLGSTEAVMAALLASQGFDVADALLVTIVCRIVTLWLAVLIGWVAVWALRQRLTPAVPSWQ